jgi:hypothetical protein
MRTGKPTSLLESDEQKDVSYVQRLHYLRRQQPVLSEQSALCGTESFGGRHRGAEHVCRWIEYHMRLYIKLFPLPFCGCSVCKPLGWE